MTFKPSFNQLKATDLEGEAISLELQKMPPSVAPIPFDTSSP
jgi:hypothetical protein